MKPSSFSLEPDPEHGVFHVRLQPVQDCGFPAHVQPDHPRPTRIGRTHPGRMQRHRRRLSRHRPHRLQNDRHGRDFDVAQKLEREMHALGPYPSQPRLEARKESSGGLDGRDDGRGRFNGHKCAKRRYQASRPGNISPLIRRIIPSHGVASAACTERPVEVPSPGGRMSAIYLRYRTLTAPQGQPRPYQKVSVNPCDHVVHHHAPPTGQLLRRAHRRRLQDIQYAENKKSGNPQPR